MIFKFLETNKTSIRKLFCIIKFLIFISCIPIFAISSTIDILLVVFYGTIDKLFINDIILFNNTTIFAKKIAKINIPLLRVFLEILYFLSMIFLLIDLFYMIY